MIMNCSAKDYAFSLVMASLDKIQIPSYYVSKKKEIKIELEKFKKTLKKSYNSSCTKQYLKQQVDKALENIKKGDDNIYDKNMIFIFGTQEQALYVADITSDFDLLNQWWYHELTHKKRTKVCDFFKNKLSDRNKTEVAHDLTTNN